jgi:HK97 family phage portal protein
MRFPQASYQWWAGSYGRSRLDYQGAVGDGRGSAIVVACINWTCRAFLEAPLRMRRYDGDDLVPEPRHAMLALIRRPNPFYAGRALWKATIADRQASGNAYWIKVRSAAGRPVELWYAPSWTMEPKWPDDGRTYISHYEYNVNRGEPIRLDPSEVVHFRGQLDPHNPRKGISPLATLLREIFTDDEAATFTAALLSNLGVPGTIISPADSDTEITQPQADQMKAEFEHRFSGDNRGRAMVLGGNVKVNTVTFTPKQMQLTDLRRLPEERVSAVLGTPAVLVGLGVGLAHSIYNNYAEAREAAFEEHLIPLGMDLAEELMLQLVPDFERVENVELDFDTSNIRVLQEDQNAAATRREVELRSGQMTVAEARQEAGRKPLADLIADRGSADPDPGDVLLLPANVTPIAIEDLLPGDEEEEPEPVVPPAFALEAPESLSEDDEAPEGSAGMQMRSRRHTNGHKAPTLVGGRVR